MTHVHRFRCDGCNREVPAEIEHRHWLPKGWWLVDGPYDGNGESYEALHVCSIECLAALSHRLRIDDALLPAVLK